MEPSRGGSKNFYLCVYASWSILRQSRRRAPRSSVRDFPIPCSPTSRKSTTARRAQNGGIIFVGSRKRKYPLQPPYNPHATPYIFRKTRARVKPRLREWLFKDNYTLTIIVLILIFILILFLKKVCFFLVRFGLFWFNLVFSKPIWKNKNQFGLICFCLVYFGFVFSKIFTIDEKFTNFLLTFCKI